MIEGIGVDIVEVAGVESAISNYGEPYLQRLFTAREIEYCRTGANSAQRYAARMAAKELPRFSDMSVPISNYGAGLAERVTTV